MSKMTFMAAIREAMNIRMRENPNVVLFGEDVGAFGGCFGVSKGMFEEFGPDRVRDTPISEGAIVGTAVGAAASGLRPIAELMFCDFLTVGMDQLVNQAAKMRYMFGGKISMPLVIRLPAGAGSGAAAQHSQSLEAWLTHVPGLKVVYPATPQDAFGLMLSAIDDDNPVIFFEHKLLLGKSDEVSSFEPIPLGKGRIAREGTDVSIITYGKQVYTSLDAAEKLEDEGVSAEVVDIRSLYPLDENIIFESLRKTHRAVLVAEAVKRGSYTGEIAAVIAEKFFDELDAPIMRVGGLNTPVPFATNLEKYFIPNEVDILNAVKKIV